MSPWLLGLVRFSDDVRRCPRTLRWALMLCASLAAMTIGLYQGVATPTQLSKPHIASHEASRPRPSTVQAATAHAVAAASGHVRYELSGGQVGEVELWFSETDDRSVFSARARFPHRSWAGTPPVRLWVRREGSLHTVVDETTRRGERGPTALMAHGLMSQLQRGWLTPLSKAQAQARGFSVAAGNTRVLDLPCRCFTRTRDNARACFHRSVLLELSGKLRGLPMRMRAVRVELEEAPPDAAFVLPTDASVEELTLERLLASKGVSPTALVRTPTLPSY